MYEAWQFLRKSLLPISTIVSLPSAPYSSEMTSHSQSQTLITNYEPSQSSIGEQEIYQKIPHRKDTYPITYGLADL